MFSRELENAAESYGIKLTEKQKDNFINYHDLLIEWNKNINLTAITQPLEIAIKHMIDSLSCYKEGIFKKNAKVIDVGTGAGFPGLPLKIMHEDIELTLLDSLNKRVSFLNTVIRSLSLPDAMAIHGRAEDAGRQTNYRECYDIAVSRAVARLNILCEFCLPLVAVGGYFIALKGSKYKEEADEAKGAISLLGGSLEKIQLIKLPELSDVRAVLYIKKIKKTHKIYPRKAGVPEKSPL